MIFQNLIESNIYLGQFGNANRGNRDDWISVTIATVPTISYNSDTDTCIFPT